MDTKEMTKEDVKKALKEYVDLIVDTSCLFSRNDSKEAIAYVSVGYLLEIMRKEMKYRKGEITLKKTDVYVNKENEFCRHIFTLDIKGQQKAIVIQTNLLTANQSRTLCEKVSAELAA